MQMNVFGLGKEKKSPIGFERVVRTLSSKRHKAPDQVMSLPAINHKPCALGLYP